VLLLLFVCHAGVAVDALANCGFTNPLRAMYYSPNYSVVLKTHCHPSSAVINGALAQLNGTNTAQVVGATAVLVQATPFGTMTMGPSVLGGPTVSLAANTGNLALNALVGGINCTVSNPNGIFSVNLPGNGLTLFDPTSSATFGYGAILQSKLSITRGLALAPTDGTVLAPVSGTVIPGPPGGVQFNMSGNKAFLTAPIGTILFVINYPLPGNNMIAKVDPIGSGFNVASVAQQGDACIVTCANPIAGGMTFSVVLL
jgi:hypothetical protein